jgi:hypothetical protein
MFEFLHAQHFFEPLPLLGPPPRDIGHWMDETLSSLRWWSGIAPVFTSGHARVIILSSQPSLRLLASLLLLSHLDICLRRPLRPSPVRLRPHCPWQRTFEISTIPIAVAVPVVASSREIGIAISSRC